MTPKPRLRYRRSVMFGPLLKSLNYWVCEGASVIATGATPNEAYEAWETKCRQRLTLA